MQQPCSQLFVQYCTTLRGGLVSEKKYRSSHQCCTVRLRMFFIENQTIYKWCRCRLWTRFWLWRGTIIKPSWKRRRRFHARICRCQRLCAGCFSPCSRTCMENLPTCFIEFQPLHCAQDLVHQPPRRLLDLAVIFRKRGHHWHTSINISV